MAPKLVRSFRAKKHIKIQNIFPKSIIQQETNLYMLKIFPFCLPEGRKGKKRCEEGQKFTWQAIGKVAQNQRVWPFILLMSSDDITDGSNFGASLERRVVFLSRHKTARISFQNVSFLEEIALICKAKYSIHSVSKCHSLVENSRRYFKIRDQNVRNGSNMTSSSFLSACVSLCVFY